MTALEKLVADTNYAHCRQVANICKIVAERAGYSTDEILIIEQAALLHDVGKGKIDKAIMDKPGKLTPEEFEIVKKHTEAGHDQIMDTIEILRTSAECAKYHHEKPDGTGYFQITGSGISPFVRLISVIDVYDALVSKRVYKDSWDNKSVIDYLTENKTQFDQYIVKCLVNSLDDVLPLYEAK